MKAFCICKGVDVGDARSAFVESMETAAKVKLESKVSSLSISAEPEAGPSSAGASGGGPGLFQDMLDNFRELAETQLQCAVCSELFVEAVSVNCGHTFCHYYITQWKKKKANCPVCRADIKQMASCKVMN